MSFSLPIDAVKKEFLQQLSSHHLVVEAETGSGKSTRLPIWAAKDGKVLVVEPRRVACTSLAEFIAVTPDDENRIWGSKIGYAIRFDNQFDQDTDIVFVTPGVALRWLSENGLTDFKTIIIDEFHERRWDTDLLLSLLLQTQSHRLVVTSATLDSQRLAEYMAAKRLTANGRMFDVEVIHQASDARSMPEIQHIERKIGQALEAHREHHQDILVFLPGRKEISSVKQSLQQKYRDDIEDGKLDVISLHASVSEQEKQRALTESEKQRIILATNVAETSLTIPGITLIIDSGLERRTHQRNGRTVLSLHAISNASAEQRKGRAGRVRSGTCIRLYGKAAPLERLTPPELLREELVEPYLAALCCGYSLESLPFIDVLPEKTLEQARSVLTKMKAIDDKGAITDHGRVLYPLPIDTLFAHLITAMPTRGLKEAMVDLSAALSVPQKLWQSPNGEEQLALLKQWLKIEGCDATALIAIVRTPFDELPDWLNVDPLVHQEAQQLSVQIRDALELPELTVASRFKRAEWLDAVMVATPELVFVRRERRRQALTNGFYELTVGRDCLLLDDAEAAIVFDQYALPGRGVKQNLVLATCMAPVTLSLIEAHHLATEQVGETIQTDDGVRTSIDYVYAGRVIKSEWRQPEGDIAQEALVDLIISNQILDGLYTKLEFDIHQWNLYLALGLYDETQCQLPAKTVVTKDWLAQQIEDLGVETVDDLEMFTCDDFTFNGIPEWERSDFDERYPAVVALNDLKMTIEYHVASKMVTAVHCDGKRKQDPKRWELPRWNGWRVKYRKASRIIDIK